MVILLADDEKFARICLEQSILDSVENPLEFLYAKNGREAIKILRQDHPPDFAFIDYKMPYFNGIEVLQAIYPINKETRCALVSGYDLSDKISHSLNVKIEGLFEKPVTKEDLKAFFTKIAGDKK